MAAKVEKDHRYTYSLNNRVWRGTADAAWDPVFSPDGTRLLLRTVESGHYVRRVVPVSEMAG